MKNRLILPRTLAVILVAGLAVAMPAKQANSESRIHYAPPYEENEVNEGHEETKAEEKSVLSDNDIVAFYGSPHSPLMGIIGQYSLENLEPRLLSFAASYDAANDTRGVIPALYLIYGTCWPQGNIGRLSEAVVKEYIDYAAERGWYVFLDHQIGKYSVRTAVEALLPFLQYENVHLALDPEWRTTRPMQQIGYITAEEINMAQQMMEDYMAANDIRKAKERILVVHQFKKQMIRNRPDVNSDFERVRLILCMDGFGSPALKKSSYAYNALATNIPLKGFKLFSVPRAKGAGYDIPMMSPEQVLGLDPRPCLIMLQ